MQKLVKYNCLYPNSKNYLKNLEQKNVYTDPLPTQQSRQIYKIDFFHHNKTKLKDRRVRRDSPLSIEREFLLRRRWIVKDRVIFSNILEKGRRVSGTRGGGTGHSVITLMHRPPSISSPHLRLRDNDSLPHRSSPNEESPNRIDPLDDRSNQWDKEARRSVCVQIVTVPCPPPPIVPPSTMGTFHKLRHPPRGFSWLPSAQIPSREIPEKKFDTVPFSSSFLRSFSKKEPTDSSYDLNSNDYLLI